MALSRLLQAKPPVEQEEGAGEGAPAEVGQELALVKRGGSSYRKRSDAPISLGLNEPRDQRPPSPPSKTALIKSEPGGRTPQRAKPEPIRPERSEPAKPESTKSKVFAPAPVRTETPRLEAPKPAGPAFAKPAEPVVKQPERRAAAASTQEVKAPADLAEIVAELPACATSELRPPIEIAAEPESFAASAAPAPALSLAPEFTGIPSSGRIELVMGGIAPSSIAPMDAAELEFIDFTLATQITSWESAVDAVAALPCVTERAKVQVDLCPTAEIPAIWHFSDYSIESLPVAIGELARLWLPTAEVEEAEGKRQAREIPPAEIAPVLNEEEPAAELPAHEEASAEPEPTVEEPSAEENFPPETLEAKLPEAPKVPNSAEDGAPPVNGTGKRPAVFKLRPVVTPRPVNNTQQVEI